MTVLQYTTADGRCPFRQWLAKLDKETAARVQQRVVRLRQGHFGDCRTVASGVHEARLFFGPGYRIYFGREGSTIILLLAGGDKASQKRDILRARWFWAGYLAEKRDGETS